jgi:hypothetical protein
MTWLKKYDITFQVVLLDERNFIIKYDTLSGLGRTSQLTDYIRFNINDDKVAKVEIRKWKDLVKE